MKYEEYREVRNLKNKKYVESRKVIFSTSKNKNCNVSHVLTIKNAIP
jgi:hypothetical protein